LWYLRLPLGWCWVGENKGMWSYERALIWVLTDSNGLRLLNLWICIWEHTRMGAMGLNGKMCCVYAFNGDMIKWERGCYRFDSSVQLSTRPVNRVTTSPLFNPTNLCVILNIMCVCVYCVLLRCNNLSSYKVAKCLKEAPLLMICELWSHPS